MRKGSSNLARMHLNSATMPHSGAWRARAPRAQQQNETKVIAMEPGTLQQVGLAAPGDEPGDGRSPVAVSQVLSYSRG